MIKIRSYCFNTQPPEGGCYLRKIVEVLISCFNTQPPEGGCLAQGVLASAVEPVSTHSRPKAAAVRRGLLFLSGTVSTHSRPKAAADQLILEHKRGKGFNTQPPEGGCVWLQIDPFGATMFQHTAARRRLRRHPSGQDMGILFQHTSRPKAAALQ